MITHSEKLLLKQAYEKIQRGELFPEKSRQFLHEEVYCSLLVSKLAKEKGFLEICTCWYNIMKEDLFYALPGDFDGAPKIMSLSHFEEPHRIGIPTKAQLINWLNSMGFEFSASVFAEEADINILFEKFLNLL